MRVEGKEFRLGCLLGVSRPCMFSFLLCSGKMNGHTERTTPEDGTMVRPKVEIADACIQALRKALGPGIRVTWRTVRRAGDQAVDGHLFLKGPGGALRLEGAIRARLTRAHLATLRPNRRGQDDPGIVLTPYVNPQTGAALQDAGVLFADTVGNVYLHGGGFHVLIRGNPPPARKQHRIRITRPAGAQILFVLLQDPRRVAEPYRVLAEMAGVALGTVGWILTDLRKKGCVHTDARGRRRLADVRGLLREWDVGYDETLRGRLHVRTCRLGRGAPLRHLVKPLKEKALEGVYLGGELGAAQLREVVRPTQATLHVPEGRERDVMKKLALVPDVEGPITLVRTFGTENVDPVYRQVALQIADPLLLRAEVLQGGDDRAREAAEVLLEEYVTPRWPK